MKPASTANSDAKADQPVTISTASQAVQIDPQNPLPEPSFFWRRWIAIGLSAFTLVLVWHTARDLAGMNDAARLYSLTRLMVYFSGLVLTYYFVAPSAAELTNMVQTAAIVRHSLSLAGIADNMGLNRPESGAGEPIRPSPAPQSQIPRSAPDGAPTARSGDSANSGEEDAAPHGRT